MNGTSYKGCFIHPAPQQLADKGRWSLNLTIGKDNGNEYVQRQFSGSNTFETEEEAIRHCVNFGQQIIDGEAGDLTVSDL